MHTVSILGINGNVGKPTTELLVKAAEQDRIKLIILHREGKSGNYKPSKNVELRVIDLEGPQEKIEEVLKGINVFVSTVGIPGLEPEIRAIEALAKSPDFVTYMPPMYSTTWSQQDLQDPVLGKFFSSFPSPMTKAQELGLPITKVYTGIFDFTFFQDGFLYASLKENSISLNDDLKKSKLAITTMPHLAQTIAHIVTTNTPESLKNREFSVISFWATGSELRDLYTKIHGKETKVIDWTPEEREVKRSGAEFGGAVRVGYMDKWAGELWEYDSGERVMVGGYEGPSLEQVARSFL